MAQFVVMFAARTTASSPPRTGTTAARHTPVAITFNSTAPHGRPDDAPWQGLLTRPVVRAERRPAPPVSQRPARRAGSAQSRPSRRPSGRNRTSTIPAGIDEVCETHVALGIAAVESRTRRQIRPR